MLTARKWMFALMLVVALPALVSAGSDQAKPDESLPVFLKDRGTGVATSMFGTYIRRGELIVYPYWEYYVDNNREYSPQELNFAGAQDFNGKFRESEGLFFVAYGLTENLAIQAEIAGAKASLEKASGDLSALPRKYEASGLASSRPSCAGACGRKTSAGLSFGTYLDVVYPTNKANQLIGTAGVEAELGSHAVFVGGR